MTTEHQPATHPASDGASLPRRALATTWRGMSHPIWGFVLFVTIIVVAALR